MNEELIKKQAADAVGVAFRYSIHHEMDKCLDVIIRKSERIYQPADKVFYFEEAIRLVKVKIDEHRSGCPHGDGCATEKKHEEIISFLQQEIDIIPNSAETGSTILVPFSPANDAPPMSSPTTSIDKIFISHSSKDKDIVEEIIDLLEIVGVNPKQIFCSSFAGYGTSLGQDFLQRIKGELNGNVLVIFVLTDNFYKSPISLCEMGAAWVRTSQHVPIIVPPLSYEDVKGVITHTHGFSVNEPLEWNLLKEQIEEWLGITNKVSASVWERKRDKAIKTIESKIGKIPPVEQNHAPSAAAPTKPKSMFRGV